MIRLLAALCLSSVLAGCAKQACDDRDGACIDLTIQSDVPLVDQLVFHVDQPRVTTSAYPEQAGEPLAFPVRLALVFPRSTSQVNVAIEGWMDGMPVGAAGGIISIPSDSFGSATFTLGPFSMVDAGADLSAGDGSVVTTPSDLSGDLSQDLATTPDMALPTFVPWVTLAATSPTALATADFDNDGVIDVAVAVAGGVGFALNPGASGSSFVTVLNQPLWAQSVATIDLNADGKLDIVSTNSGNQGASYLSNGNGTFQSAVSFNFPGSGTSSYIAAGDFDGDGRGDIAAPVFSGNEIMQVFLSPSGSPNTNGGSYALPQFCGQASATGDLDGDGRPDVVMVCGTSKSIKMMFHTTSNVAGSLFSSGTQISLPDWGGGIAVADVNHDGHQDVLVSSTSLLVFGGTGTPTPNLAVSSAAPFAPGLAVADFDGDGNEDVAMTDQGNDRVVIMRNTGQFAFTPWRSVPVGDAPVAIVAADFDGDGKKDFATANASGNSVSILLNRSY